MVFLASRAALGRIRAYVAGNLNEEFDNRPWFVGVPRYAWLVLVVAALGWLFDTLDQQLFTLIRYRSLQDILSQDLSGPALDSAIKVWSSILTSVFLTGWAIGGFVFGLLGDKLGRARTMLITIFIYALFTGLNALVHTPVQYAACRFLTALGIGGEFAAGAALVAEVWPQRSRAMALGFLQALSTVGNMSAAGVTYQMADTKWQYVYLVGIIPALLVVVIRLFVKEPERWQNARNETSEEAREGAWQRPGAFHGSHDPAQHVCGPADRACGVLGLWGIGYFQPDFLSQVMKSEGRRRG